MKNIYLTGMRGVGKTTIGRHLAQQLGKEFIDMDAFIEQTTGKKVSDVVAGEGWEAFRAYERQAVQVLVLKEEVVISTGGGVLMHFDNAEKLLQSGKIVLLTASIPTLQKRIEDSPGRPSLRGFDVRQELEQVWNERKDYYYRFAAQVVDSEGKSPEEVVQEIIRNL